MAGASLQFPADVIVSTIVCKAVVLCYCAGLFSVGIKAYFSKTEWLSINSFQRRFHYSTALLLKNNWTISMLLIIHKLHMNILKQANFINFEIMTVDGPHLDVEHCWIMADAIIFFGTRYFHHYWSMFLFLVTVFECSAMRMLRLGHGCLPWMSTMSTIKHCVRPTVHHHQLQCGTFRSVQVGV